MPRMPDEIWADDLLDRREEATHLLAYIESLSGRRVVREDKKAYTVAVDAPYGVGKTFFLRRFAEFVALSHPVAYIDAWADDLADEPLTALVATLKHALEKHQTPTVRERMGVFMRKAGRVAGIAGIGLLKRGLSLAITMPAVDKALDVVHGEDFKDIVTDGAEKISDGAVEDVAKGIADTPLMDKRVDAFEAGQAAIADMKASLRALVGALDDTDASAPIIIVIDELDRCRPTYAIKLLEEIKHLFDVPGLVFILGMHGDQLSHSVNATYGATFDGAAYLRRFIDRRYTLPQPGPGPVVNLLCRQLGLSAEQFHVPRIARHQDRLGGGVDEIIAAYMRAYGLTTRDAFQLTDMLQTCAALASGQKLYLVYLLPLAIATMRGRSELPEEVPAGLDYKIVIHRGYQKPDSEYRFQDLAQKFDAAAALRGQALSNYLNKDGGDAAWEALRYSNDWNFNEDNQPVWSVINYRRLLSTVARFSNPAAVDP